MANPRLKRHGQEAVVVRCKCGLYRLDRLVHRAKLPAREVVVFKGKRGTPGGKRHSFRGCEAYRG